MFLFNFSPFVIEPPAAPISINIVYISTIQHITTQFNYLSKSFEVLKLGYLVFLATPNVNSAVYKL